jgi:hypothetical protein
MRYFGQHLDVFVNQMTGVGDYSRQSARVVQRCARFDGRSRCAAVLAWGVAL